MLRSKVIEIDLAVEAKRFDCGYFFKVLETVDEINISKYSVKPLSDKSVTNLITDGEHQPLNRLECGKYRYLYGRNLKEGFVHINDVNDLPYISEKEYSRAKRIQAENNDVLLAIKGTVGKAAVYYKEYVGDAALPREIAKIVTVEDKLLPGYLCIFLLSSFGRKQTSFSGSGNIHPLLTLNRLKKVKVVIPPINKQKAISDLYELSVKKEIEALKKINMSVRIIEKEIDSSIGVLPVKEKAFFADYDKLDNIWTPEFHQPQYISTIKLITDKFKCDNLGKLAKIDSGNEVGSENYKNYFKRSDTDVPFIRTTDIYNYEIDNYPDFYISEEIFSGLGQDLNATDILFTNDGKIGLSAVLQKQDKCIIQSHIYRIRASSCVPQWFLFAFILTKYAQFYFKKSTVIQSTIPTIRDRLKYLPIPAISDKTIEDVVTNIEYAMKRKNEKKELLAEAKNLIEKEIR